jgi:3-oxoacyl-[acyl-carrier-protein] synthase III
MISQRTSALRKTRFRISGFGSAYPSGTLTNRDLAAQLGVDAGRIESRCGIQSRYVAGQAETTHSLAGESTHH